MPDRAPTHAEYELEKRIYALEIKLKETERRQDVRLSDGAKTFHKHEDRLADLEARMLPKPADKWKVAGLVIGVLLTVAAWVWQAARYPDRAEYNGLAQKVEQLDDQVDGRVRLLREAQVDAATKVMLLGRDFEQVKEALKRLQPDASSRRRRR